MENYIVSVNLVSGDTVIVALDKPQVAGEVEFRPVSTGNSSCYSKVNLSTESR